MSERSNDEIYRAALDAARFEWANLKIEENALKDRIKQLEYRMKALRVLAHFIEKYLELPPLESCEAFLAAQSKGEK